MMPTEGIRVTVFTTMPPGVYSGGRYLSLMLATAMARAGAEVTYVTNNAPLFEQDFAPYSGLAPVRHLVTPDFLLPSDLVSDWVVVIPTGGSETKFYDSALNHARACRARMALLSFETPNWYAALSPFPRSPLPTENWRQVVAGGGLIVTIAAEGIPPARAYFGEERSDLAFGFWHPAINDLAAEAALAIPAGGPRQRVVMFTRTEDMHKGAQDLLALPPDLFEGHVLSLVFGRGVDEAYLAALRRHFAPARDFAIEVHSRIDDVAKFALLAQARLLLFPSYFEGFGYPPVEAAWMGVPSVVYDLPLLREVAPDSLLAVPPGDTAAFAAAVRRVLSGAAPAPLTAAALVACRAGLRVAPDTLSAGRKMLALLADAQYRLPPAAPAPAARPAPRNPRADLPQVHSLLSRQTSNWQLSGLSAVIRGDRLTVSGLIANAAADDRMRFVLKGARLPDVYLRFRKDNDAYFTSEGVIQAWPGGTTALLRLILVRSGGVQVQLGQMEVAADWPQLLTDDEPLAGPDALVLVDPAGWSSPAVVQILAECCDALTCLGHRVRFMLPPGLPAPADLPIDLDLLPLAARVDQATPEVMAQAVAGIVRDGGIVVMDARLTNLPPLPVAPGRAIWRLALPEVGPGAPCVALSGAAAGQDRTIPVMLDAIAGRRSLARRARQAVIVLMADSPPAALSPKVLDLLHHVEAHCRQLRVVIPARLSPPQAAWIFGTAGLVEPLAEADLARTLAAASRIVGLELGALGSDPVGAALLAACAADNPAIVAHDDPEAMTHLLAALQPVQPVPADLVADQAAARSFRIAAVVAALAGPALPRPLLPRAIYAVAALPSPALPPLPLLTPGVALSLSLTMPDAIGGMTTGWRSVNVFGAEIAGGAALLGFVRDDQPVPGETLELMLRLSGDAAPEVTLRVELNGHALGQLTKLPLGVSRHALEVPVRAWAGPGPQTLLLRPGGSAPPKCAIRLGAVAVLPPGPPRPRWADHAPAARTMAALATARPLVVPAPGAESLPALSSCRFGNGAAPGFAQLLSGWSGPEPDLVWSDGPAAAVGFRPAFSGHFPLRLDIEGASLPAADGAGQRIRLRTGGIALAEMVTEATRQSIGVCLPAALVASGVDYLLLNLPDARRPSDLGLNQDPRLLGLAISGLTCTPCTQQTGQAEVTTAADGIARVSLFARTGVLCLSGTAPLPAGTVLVDAAGRLVHPVATPGGWEAGFPLDQADLALGGIAVAGLPPNVTVKLSAWAASVPAPERQGIAPVAESAAVPLRVALVTTSPLPMVLPDDLRDWPASRAATLLTVAARPALALPAVFGLRAGDPEAGLRLLAEGWSEPESFGTWTDGNAARLVLPGLIAAGALLTLDVAGHVPPGYRPQEVGVADIYGRLLARLFLPAGFAGPIRLVLPPGAGPVTAITLDLPGALSPAATGQSADSRHLALMASALALDALDPAADVLPVSALGTMAITAVLPCSGGRVVVVDGPAGLAPPWGLAATPEVVVHCQPLAGGGWRAWLVIATPAAALPGLHLQVLVAPPRADGPAPTEIVLDWPSGLPAPGDA